MNPFQSPNENTDDPGDLPNCNPLGADSSSLPAIDPLDQDLPPAEMFDEEQQQYLLEVNAFGGSWVARGSDGQVIVATPHFEDLDDAVRLQTGSDSTPYTPERIFSPSEFSSELTK